MIPSALKKLTAFALSVLLLVPSLQAQQKVTLSGTVVDALGPVIAAGVVQQGTTNGTVTDADGHFSLTVPSGATVEISAMGYLAQQIVVNASQTVTVTLEEDNFQLEETVVVGYGVQKKSDLTGAISSVKAQDLEARTITDASQALQGKTAGVQVMNSSARPGASPTIRIRGISSNGDCDPLYVVDGRVTSDIGGIDPNDIESMEVLKDGASAAIYGASAGNGVVLITTKKGKGEGKISYEFQYSIQSLGKTPKVMNSEQYIDYYTEAGLISLDQVYRNWDFQTNTDWINTAFEKGAMQRHNLSFQSGNDKGSLYASINYLNNNGMFVGNADTYERITGMVNVSWNIKPWLEFGSNNQLEFATGRNISDAGTVINSHTDLNAILSALRLDPLTKPVYAANELPANMQLILDNPDWGGLLGDGKGNYYGISNFIIDSNPNPLILRDRSYMKSRRFVINGTTFLNIKPIKGLLITSRFSYKFTGSNEYTYDIPYYANQKAQQSYVTLASVASVPGYFQWENFVNYTKDFGKHNLGVMLGTSYSQTHDFNVSGNVSGGEGDLGVQKNNPLFYYFGYRSASSSLRLYGGEDLFKRKLAYFGRVNWSYAGKYLVQASLRADAADSSVLPVAKRWGYFPAVSAGWTISEEPFMEGAKSWLSFLKIRASWGQNGSLASLGDFRYANSIASFYNYYATEALPTSANPDYGYIYGYAPSSSGNNELKWETSEQTDLGLDARFLGGRLTFSMDWFNKTTKDLIVEGLVPSTIMGVTASPMNAGNIRNTGFEFELGWSDQIGKDFTYSIRGNLSTLKNQVTKIHETATYIQSQVAPTRFEVGQPAWYFYGYKLRGIDPATGEPEFENLDDDPTIGDGDKTYIGKGIPDLTGGITLNASWKGIDLLVFGTGSYGSQILCSLNSTSGAYNKLTYFTEDRWTPTHTQATQPRAGANGLDKYAISSASVFDGSYFKIKQIQLGYSLPLTLLSKIRMSHLRIYASLDDWFTFTKYPGFDPEITGIGQSLGIDSGSYPTSKKVVFGVQVTF
jgi:TonB-linked SusC/RagA family outer membrane protein